MPDVDTERNSLAEAARMVGRPVIAVVMGVSSSGKTTVAKRLAKAICCSFQEGDDLHPEANVEKMSAGTPLSDADRIPWLERIAEEIDAWRLHGQSGVLTCSALKRAYREKIIGRRGDVTLVYLRGSHELIAKRMAARQKHFMPLALLDSQFATLEPPGPDENPIIVDVQFDAATIVAEILRALATRRQRPDNASPRSAP